MIMDNYTGEVVRLYGRNSLLSTTRENLAAHSTFVDYSSVTTATKVQVSSASTDDAAAGTGARTLRVFGLDDDYNFQYDDITMDGQTAVESTKSFIRVFCAEVTSAGSGQTNAGIIYIIVSGTGGSYSGGVPGTLTGVWIQIIAGYGTETSGMFTVPAGRHYLIESGYAATVTQISNIQIWSYHPTNGVLLNNFSTIVGVGAQVDITTVAPQGAVYPAKTDIYLRGLSYTAGGNANATLFFRWVQRS
jgi:hypothetical protein